MSSRWLGIPFAFAFALAAQPAAAKQDIACPEGQAIRAIDDKTAICVPVPPPVDLAPLNAAISAETAARKTADEELPDRLEVGRGVDRKSLDFVLRCHQLLELLGHLGRLAAGIEYFITYEVDRPICSTQHGSTGLLIGHVPSSSTKIRLACRAKNPTPGRPV